MSRTFKSVVAALLLVMSISASASAAEYCSGANFLSSVQAYFSGSDPLPGAIPAMPAETPKVDSEKYVTLGDLDLSTIKNVLRRTAPLPSGLPSNDDAPAAVAAPVYYEAAPAVTYAAPAVSYAAPVYYETAPVVTYAAPVSYSYPVVTTGLVSSSTNTNCSTCRNR